ncbi:MAG TPA: hypothetical protein VJA25_03435 [Dehalococcoidia bacterium]|nr:hypothetical protein [Dehalococcoidia bacterium]
MIAPKPIVTVTSSEASAHTAIRAVVHAPPDRSKTFSSLTLSEKCPVNLTHLRPKVLTRRTPMVTLDDLLWVCFDRGATAGFLEQGLTVPQIDLSDVDMTRWDEVVPQVHSLIKEHVSRGVQGIVIDTASSLDRFLSYRANIIKGLRKFDLYDDVRNSHSRFATPIMALPCHVLFLCHSRALLDMDGTSEAVQNQQRARRAAGLGGIVPAITGQSLTYYTANSSLVMPIIARKKPEGIEYFFAPGHPEFDAKRRFYLPDEMPADWRLVKRALGMKE